MKVLGVVKKFCVVLYLVILLIKEVLVFGDEFVIENWGSNE